MMPPPCDSIVLHYDSIIAAQLAKVNEKGGVRLEAHPSYANNEKQKE
jgi:hypothetical protein